VNPYGARLCKEPNTCSSRLAVIVPGTIIKTDAYYLDHEGVKFVKLISGAGWIASRYPGKNGSIIIEEITPTPPQKNKSEIEEIKEVNPRYKSESNHQSTYYLKESSQDYDTGVEPSRSTVDTHALRPNSHVNIKEKILEKVLLSYRII